MALLEETLLGDALVDRPRLTVAEPEPALGMRDVHARIEACVARTHAELGTDDPRLARLLNAWTMRSPPCST